MKRIRAEGASGPSSETTVPYVELNRDLWNKRVRAHLDARLYPSESVAAGTYVVGEPDAVEVGDVRGLRLLHLQCNAGADTIHWARQGASVVGVDFSSEAITEARRLGTVTGVPAEFICSDIYAVHEHDLGRFDVVYTSMGVLWWLPDLDGWARIIAEHLTDDGFFYISEIHPFAMTVADDDGRLVLANGYFGSSEPIVFPSSGTYYESGDDFEAEEGTECGWVHSMGDIITALSEAGLRIEYLHEHPYTHFRMIPSFVGDDRGHWRPQPGHPELPLTFSLRARRST